MNPDDIKHLRAADPFLKHEALDRCSLLASMADDYLLNHEYVQARPDLLALATEAVDKLAAAYQAIGASDSPRRSEMTDYTNLIEQLLTKSENSPWDSLMDDAAIAIQSQGKRIAELEAQLSAIRALLPDDLYSHSKDWSSGDLAYRIEWLKIGYESEKSLVRDFMTQIDDIWKQSPIGEVTHSDVLPGDDGLYRHEFRSSERIGLQAELFAQPVNTRLLDAAKTVLCYTHAECRPPVRDEIECGRMTTVRVHALADLHEAVQAAEAQQSEPVLPANKTHGDSHAWLAWALHIIRERCHDVIPSHQYDCASKALAAGYAKEPVRISRQQRAALIAEFDQSSKRHPVRIAVVDLMNRTEAAALRANGFKVED